MRTLTDAQKIELTEDSEVRFILTSTPVNFTSKFINSLTTAYYDVGFEIDDIEEDVHYMGGMAATAGLSCRINKVDDFLDYIEGGGTRVYIENEEVSISVRVNATTHTLYKGVFTNCTINQDYVEFEIEDETNKADVDLLTEITKENYPNAPDESLGCYLPLLYNESTVQHWNIPAVQLQKAYPMVYYAHHSTDNYSGAESVRVYFDQIDTYGVLTNLIDSASTVNSTHSYYTFLDADCDIIDYTKYTIGRQGDEIADIADIHNIYDAASGSCNIAAAETLSIVCDFGDLGYIYGTGSFTMEITGTITNTPELKLVDAITGTAIATDVINDGFDTYSWDGYDDAGTPWTFQNIREREFQVVCAAGEAIDLTWIAFNVQFAMYDKNAKRVRLGRAKSILPGRVKRIAGTGNYGQSWKRKR